MTYVGDQKRLDQLALKSQRRNITPEGLITASLTWEDHLEIEAIQERRALAETNGHHGGGA